ncbi:uncharacterized protein [Amphiura filiformis]|uniref:uncharacterized protein n=1 Tax=Amphiura filiformis TaxID=82378 RepID=UPI003B2158BA
MSSAERKSSKVILWSTPRSLSTVLTKCLSFVLKSVIWFEPYNTYKWCKEQLEAEYRDKSVVFVQAKADALSTRYDAIPRGYKHSFLIRNPLKVLLSWRKAVYKIMKPDTALETFKLSTESQLPPGYFFKEMYDLYQYIKENYESNPIILDADDLLMNPGGVLKAYCNSMDIPYTDDLLHWDPSGDVIMTWKTRSILLKLQQLADFTFIDKAITSSEFLKPTKRPSREDLTEDDLQCIDFCMPYYEKMYEKRLIC